jgi:predicted double-glycine peptidase
MNVERFTAGCVGLAKSARAGRWGLIALFVAVALCGASPRTAQAQLRAPVRDRSNFVSKYVWSYRELANRQIVMQQRDYSCGAATLATVIRYYWGDPVREDQFLDILEKMLTVNELKDRIENGLGLTDLRNMANKAGYDATIGKVQLNELAEAKIPVIVGITVNGHDHFAVFRGMVNGWVYLADPIRGNLRVGADEFRRQWQKNAILVVAKPGADVKAINPMAVRYEEIYRGWLNPVYVRQDGMMYKPQMSIALPQ